MQYLTEVCNLDAVCPFSKLLKALETSNSNRLVEFFEILSFSRNLPMEIWFPAEENISWAMPLTYLSAKVKFVKSKEIIGIC